jgi:hypothetical protein
MDFDFSKEIATIEEVPENFRGLYTKDKDGKVKLDSDHQGVKSAVVAVLGLNNALKAERAASKDLKSKVKTVDLTPLAEYGATPEDILKAFNTKFADVQKSKPDVEKLRESFAREHAQALGKVQGEKDVLSKQLEALLIDNASTSAIVAEEGDAELLMPFVRSQVRLFSENGQLVARVVDAAGNVEYSGVTAKPKTPAELVKEMKANAKYARLFNSKTPSGAGSGDPKPKGRPTQPQDRELSATEKIMAGLANGEYQNSREQRQDARRYGR